MSKKTPTASVVYSKGQLLRSKRFAQERDLLNALLPEGEYTIDQVVKTIELFLKKEAM